MAIEVQGPLIIIGGAEDRHGECAILYEVVKAAGGRDANILVISTASREGDSLGVEYRDLFLRLGARKVEVFHINDRPAANRPNVTTRLEEATGIFFTGGDQLRITSLLGGTMLEKKLQEGYRRGVVIAGTSAGAAAMSETMIVAGPDEDPPQRCTLKMAPGLRLLREVVVDQHFAQRGRLGRLLSVVAQNPYILGLGIDEDTAVLVEPQGRFKVLGSCTVTVIDGRYIEVSNVSEAEPEAPLALTHVFMHVLPQGYGFDLRTRTPLSPDKFAEGKEDES